MSDVAHEPLVITRLIFLSFFPGLHGHSLHFGCCPSLYLKKGMHVSLVPVHTNTADAPVTISLIFFLFGWIKYLTFYISKVLILRYLKVLLFYKFDFLEQYLREGYNTTSGFHFETKFSTSVSRAFICLHYWMEVSRLFFYHLKTSIK